MRLLPVDQDVRGSEALAKDPDRRRSRGAIEIADQHLRHIRAVSLHPLSESPRLKPPPLMTLRVHLVAEVGVVEIKRETSHIDRNAVCYPVPNQIVHAFMTNNRQARHNRQRLERYVLPRVPHVMNRVLP